MLKQATEMYNHIRGNVIMPTVFQVIIHPCIETNGYWAECPQLQGCNTQGKTLREINTRIIEAIDLCLEDYSMQVDDYILEFEVCDA